MLQDIHETDTYEVQVLGRYVEQFETLGPAFNTLEAAVNHAQQLAIDYRSTRVVRRNTQVRSEVIIHYGGNQT